MNMIFCVLMTITVKFDLKTVQLNAVNVFINCKLNEMIYIKQSFRFETDQNMIFWLWKILYRLRKFSLLWQKKLTSMFRSLDFKKISQKFCVMINKEMIIFFYIDDIIVCYRKKNEQKIKNVIIDLKIQYEMNELESLRWFLEIHILWNRAKRLFWLSQEFYINKLANQFCVDLSNKKLAN